MTWGWGLILTIVGYLATLILIRWVLLTPKRQPVSSVAWILVILMLPIVGGGLFIVFGINRVNRRVERKRLAARNVRRLLPEMQSHVHQISEDDDSLYRRMMKLANRVSDFSVLNGNRIEVIHDTNRTFGLIQEAVRSATESIHLEYYIWQPDKTGTFLRDLLIEKAREGITIRFLFDRLGSLWLRNKFLQPMRDAGIHVAEFLPGMTFRERWSFNLRNHRKIIVVDGTVGFTGGMNIGDEYLGKDPDIGYWRDTHVRITGPGVLQLQWIFAEDWYYASGEELTEPKFFPSPETKGTSLAQVVSGEPRGENQPFYSIFFSAINEARDEILLTTSYFVPPSALAVALETAALRGVKVKLLLAGRSDIPGTIWAARSYYLALLEAGCEIYEYQRGQLHSKVLTIDGVWATVGSPNFDSRSLELNFEAGILCYDRRVANVLNEQFVVDLEHAKQINLKEWEQRPTRKILLENFARLFSPVM